MAKVKIQGHASGTGVLTVTAPNTDTDRTITLPDEDVTLGAATPSIDDNGNATAMTIDSSENVLVGQTTSNFDAKGIRMRGDVGQITATRDGAAPLALNRLTSDGSVLDFNKAGNGVGSIGVTSSGAYITLGGTAAANTLDDYEEGTWTMALTCGSGSVTQSNAAGNYTKIGRQVTLTGYADVASISSPSGLLTIGGIPFDNASNATGFYTAVAVQGSNWVSSVTDLYGSLSGNNLYIFGFSSGNQTAVADKLQVGSAININVSYFTA